MEEIKPLSYSIVIATVGRARQLERTLETIASQSRQPDRVIVVDASNSEELRTRLSARAPAFPMDYLQTTEPSAAMQRNQGAKQVTTPLVAFIDDDMDLLPQTCERICREFEQDRDETIGGIAARMEGASHPPPKGLLWLYYRLQAGFYHETYGAKLFGPAINCFPCFQSDHQKLIRADWLNSACVFFRTPVFAKEQFPHFSGSSFMEDVHLSARIAKTHALYFHPEAVCIHRDGARSVPAGNKDACRQAAQRIINQRIVANEVLGTRHLWLRLFFHKLFVTVSILRFQSGGKRQSILGTWSA